MLLLLVLFRAAPCRRRLRRSPRSASWASRRARRSAAVGQQVESLGGKGLHCLRSKRDRSVSDCRATVVDPASRRVVDLWLSAIDSSAGVMMISSPLTGVELDSWRSGLESAFGNVGPTCRDHNGCCSGFGRVGCSALPGGLRTARRLLR